MYVTASVSQQVQGEAQCETILFSPWRSEHFRKIRHVFGDSKVWAYIQELKKKPKQPPTPPKKNHHHNAFIKQHLLHSVVNNFKLWDPGL